MQRSRIKLLLITPSLITGGSQRVITYLANNLDRNKFDINLLVINNKNPISTFSSSGINVIDLKIKRVRSSIFKIIKVSKKINPDIVFSTQFHLNLYLMLFKKLFSSKIKFIARETNILSLKD